MKRRIVADSFEFHFSNVILFLPWVLFILLKVFFSEENLSIPYVSDLVKLFPKLDKDFNFIVENYSIELAERYYEYSVEILSVCIAILIFSCLGRIAAAFFIVVPLTEKQKVAWGDQKGFYIGLLWAFLFVLYFVIGPSPLILSGEISLVKYVPMSGKSYILSYMFVIGFVGLIYVLLVILLKHLDKEY